MEVLTIILAKKKRLPVMIIVMAVMFTCMHLVALFLILVKK